MSVNKLQSTKPLLEAAHSHPNKFSIKYLLLSIAQIIIVMIGNTSFPSAAMRQAPLLRQSATVKNPNVLNSIANALLKVAFSSFQDPSAKIVTVNAAKTLPNSVKSEPRPLMR